MSDNSSAVTVAVPAKVNLSLEVGPLRPDGFHELRTVFHAVELYDLVTAAPAPRLSLRVTGPEGVGLPADGRNLAWRAAVALADRLGRPAAVELTVHKSIPVAAGLAGGSADAAGALAACAALWGEHPGAAVLDELAAGLGSDVTFAGHGGTALGTGRGEQLQPHPSGPALHWVLAAAAGGLSTPAVYAELDRLRAAGGDPTRAPIDHAAILAAVTAGDPVALAPLLANDLQPAAVSLAPGLAATLAAGRRHGALAGLVSGSGPTCLFLAADGPDAARLAAGLTAAGVCRFARAVRGGAPGARTVAAGAPGLAATGAVG